MRMGDLPAWMYEHHDHAWCPRRLRENIRSPGIGVTMDACELPCGC